MTPPSLLAERDTQWCNPALLSLSFAPEPGVLVGMHGFAQTGKDTAAAYLIEQGFSRIALAEPILEALVRLDPIVAVDNRGRTFRFAEVLEAEGYEGAKKTPEFRRLMQVFGTEVGRQFLGALLGVDTWIDIADRKADDLGHVVVTDVRFPDEAEWVKKREGILVKVVRPGYGPINGHLSDAGLPDHLFDHVIVNDGTIADLHSKIAAAVLR